MNLKSRKRAQKLLFAPQEFRDAKFRTVRPRAQFVSPPASSVGGLRSFGRGIEGDAFEVKQSAVNSRHTHQGGGAILPLSSPRTGECRRMTAAIARASLCGRAGACIYAWPWL